MQTIKPKEITTDEKKALLEELRLKKDELDNLNITLKGGYSNLHKRVIKSVDELIIRNNLIMEMRQIEHDQCGVLDPKFLFEKDKRWTEIQKVFRKDQLDEMANANGELKQNKTNMLDRKPILQKQIHELQKQFDFPLSEFKDDAN